MFYIFYDMRKIMYRRESIDGDYCLIYNNKIISKMKFIPRLPLDCVNTYVLQVDYTYGEHISEIEIFFCGRNKGEILIGDLGTIDKK